MATSSRFSEELRHATQSHTLRDLAGESGWGRSTIHEWWTDVRVPTAEQLDDLLDAVESEPQVRARLHELRAAESAERESADAGHQHPTSPDPVSEQDDPVEHPHSSDVSSAGTPGSSVSGSGDESGDAPTSLSPSKRRPWRLILLGAGALVVVAGVGVGIGVSLGEDSPTVDATVVNTGGRGVSKRETPDRAGNQVGALPEGTAVKIVCVSATGDQVTSTVQHGRTSRVWALLDDGSWVSDLYLDTAKSWPSPQRPPEPLRLCGRS